MKIFYIVLLVLTSLYSRDLTKDLLNSKFLSKDTQKYDYLKKHDLSKELFTNLSIKLILNKDKVKDTTTYLKIVCDTQNIAYSNLDFEKYTEYIIIKLNSKSPEKIILNFKYEKPSLFNISLAKLTRFEYKYILKKEILLYGLAYGILFSAFLYNFVIYLFYRQKLFLYYSLMQFSAIFILYYSAVFSNQTYVTSTQLLTSDFMETFCLLALYLFSKEILNTKKKLKKTDYILNVLIYLSIIDLITIFIFGNSLLYEYLPRSIVFAFLIVSGFISFFKGNKIAPLYCLSWFFLFIGVFLDEHDLTGINIIYLVHILIPLESFILSFALGYKLKMSLDEQKDKEQMLVQQSKLASMGEMLNNIAHQWRQPLTNLSFINADLKIAVKEKQTSDDYLNEIIHDSNYQIDFMSETLENLKGFYLPNKKKENFYISQAVTNVINIIKPILENENINLEFKIIKDKQINSYQNEYSQVILNLLSNAKDALLEKSIKDPFIKISLDVDSKNRTILSVDDNAKGISENIIKNIFNPYFTTKETNSGIGLYMSKIIVESHLNGSINVLNSSFGASFIIKI